MDLLVVLIMISFNLMFSLFVSVCVRLIDMLMVCFWVFNLVRIGLLVLIEVCRMFVGVSVVSSVELMDMVCLLVKG